MSLYATCRCGIPEGQEGAHCTDCPLYGVTPMNDIIATSDKLARRMGGRFVTNDPVTDTPGTLEEAIARLSPPLRVEAFNHVDAGRGDFMAMIVRDDEPGCSSILAQQLQDQTAEDICTALTEAADEIASLRARVEAYREALSDTQSTMSAVKAEAVVDGGGTCLWIAERLNEQMVANAAPKDTPDAK